MPSLMIAKNNLKFPWNFCTPVHWLAFLSYFFSEAKKSVACRASLTNADDAANSNFKHFFNDLKQKPDPLQPPP
jgi:hypothetical protein